MSLPERKSARLMNYDYSSQNYYFVTVCTHKRTHLFGRADRLSSIGRMAESELLKVSEHFENLKIDKYVIMPNHIHAIIVIGCIGETQPFRKSPSLSSVIGLYKSGVSKLIHQQKLTIEIWQRSFYDHIIRNNQDYEQIWEYIDTNPEKWKTD